MTCMGPHVGTGCLAGVVRVDRSVFLGVHLHVQGGRWHDCCRVARCILQRRTGLELSMGDGKTVAVQLQTLRMLLYQYFLDNPGVIIYRGCDLARVWRVT